MADVEIISFDEALAQSTEGKRHLLLGDGFSIALKPDIFTYVALYNDANFDAVPHAEAIFDALETRHFESVIKVLVDMSRELTAYEDVSADLIEQIECDAESIKTIVVSAISCRRSVLSAGILPAETGALNGRDRPRRRRGRPAAR